MERLQSAAATLLGVAAFLLAIFPSVIKMYETSHWFREGEVSTYDLARDWFDEEALPYKNAFDSSKTLMRVYFFIVPYLLMGVLLTVRNILVGGKQSPALIPRCGFLHKVVNFPRTNWIPHRVSYGELLGIVTFLVVNIGTFAVRVRRSLPRGSQKIDFLQDLDEDASKEPIDFWSWQATEIWAKTFGVVTIVNLSWYLLMPIGRRSILLEALGMSWERGVKYHRWVGFYTVWIMVIHSALYIAVWIHGNGKEEYDPDAKLLTNNLYPWGCQDCDEDQLSSHRINMYGIVCLILVLLMTFFAFSWMRRNKFEWFYYIHHLFFPLLVAVCLHYDGAIYYLVPGIAVYGIDKLMGLLAQNDTIMAKTRMVSSNVVEFTFRLAPGYKYHAGQYVFLNVPSISFLEWHPFSLTSSPGYDGHAVFRFHLKEAGDWTQKVMEAAKNQSTMCIRLDGFYGHEPVLRSHSGGVALIGGGIGVTPMISLAMELLTTSKIPIYLFWIVRTVDEFKIFQKELSEALASSTPKGKSSRLQVKAWITLSQPEPTPSGDEEELVIPNVCREAMAELSDEIKFERVAQALEQTATLVPKRLEKDVSEFSSVYTPRGFSNRPVMNTLFMLLAIWAGLTMYALVTWYTNNYEESVFNMKREYVVLLNFGLQSASVILIAVIGKQFQPCAAGKFNDDDSTMDEFSASPSSAPSLSGDEVAPQSSWDETFVDDIQGKDLLSIHGGRAFGSGDHYFLSKMLLGNIGCRPSLAEELRSIEGTDIGVVACGPMAMIESISSVCNEDSAVFTFTEDDWEW